MGKFKNLSIGAASIALAILTCTGTDIGGFMRKAAFASAGIYEKPENPNETHKPSTDSESVNSSSDVADKNSENSAQVSGDQHSESSAIKGISQA